MSSIACQGLNSCLVEPPRVLRLKLAPALPNPSPATVSVHGSDDWLRNCFFQSPSDTSLSVDGIAPEYIHPLTKRRLSMLSEKSLEMCTESLGSETGTHVGDYYVSPAAVHGGKETKLRTTKKKLDRAQSFPPPLKSTGMRVRSRREGGRLVMEAVTAAEWRSVFRVERSEGRIRVEMLRDSEVAVAAKVTELDAGGMVVSGGGGEGMRENIEIVEGELGTEKFGRPIRRCMESQRRSNQGLLKQNWEPFLVTI